MKRITKKRTDGFYELTAEASEICTKEGGLAQVVGQYEDIEEDLGMPLERLIAVLKNGFWAMATEEDNFDLFNIKNMKDVVFDFCRKQIVVYFEYSEEIYKIYKFKSYGKTWALTKEELTNE